MSASPSHDGIRVIGFDLDQTLYAKSPEIDTAIQKYLYEQIALHKKCSVEDAQKLFTTHYPQLSGSKTLALLGIPNASELVQEALEKADLTPFLNPNPPLNDLLRELKQKYGSLSLLTGSNTINLTQKLQKLQIPLEWFDLVVDGTTPKRDGTAYKDWLYAFQSKDPSLKPENFLYIGDRYVSDVEPVLKLGMHAWLVNVSKVDAAISVPQFAKTIDIREKLL